MPSPRKRIGFLPSLEIQEIIDKICKNNKLSQSKVTGILVEEALNKRGILNTSLKKLVFESNYKSNASKNVSNNSLSIDFTEEDILMINDFIEYKFFKKIINQNKNNII